METRADAYLRILHLGLLLIREEARAGNARLCEIEADHLHNLPTLLHEPNDARHQYYIHEERSLYLHRLIELNDPECTAQRKRLYEEPWKVLTDLATDGE